MHFQFLPLSLKLKKKAFTEYEKLYIPQMLQIRQQTRILDPAVWGAFVKIVKD